MINNKVFYIYNMNSKIATVYRSTGSWYLVKDADGTLGVEQQTRKTAAETWKGEANTW